MLVAAAVTALGLLLVGAVTQLFGYRLGGSITVPVLAVYTLKNVYMLPVFLLSTALAYVGLWLAKRRTLVYGRDELLVAMAIGSGVPVVVFVTLGAFIPESLRTVVFIGSILPGLAAFNYHRVKPEYRRWDLLAAALLYVGLTGLGWLLVTPELSAILGRLTPPALYAETADVAVLKGAAVVADLDPTILARPVAVALFLVGLVASERVRARYGLRIGLVAVPLLAVYALASGWLLVLYAVTLVAAFAFLSLFHYVTLLYGRVLISVTTAFALLAVTALVFALPVTRGLSAYFVGILAGVNAYNWHTAPPRKGLLFVPLTVGLFSLMLVLARATGRVLPRGVPQSFGPVVVVACLLVALACFAVAELYTVDRPSREAVFEASVLSGGDRR